MTAAAVTPTSRPRIQGFSDLIFGLALSIGAIQLLGSNRPGDVFGILSNLLFFGFSFLILINIWSRYTEIANLVPVETPGMLRLNFVLLFLVVIEPYLFFQLTSTSSSLPTISDVSSLYGLDLGGMTLVLAYLAHLITKGNLVPTDRTAHFRQSRNTLIVAGLTFAISATPIFWAISILGQPLRIILWVLTLAFSRLTKMFWK